MDFEPGTRVRLKGDPGVTGRVAANPPFELAGRIFVEVDVPSGRRKYPVNQLERTEGPANAFEDLKAGKFSSPNDLRRALTHLRMTGRLADMIYSLGATNTEFHAYQFKPVLKLLNSPSRGLLIADEVGLGKTIEAGLVWTELVARFDCRRLLVVCPKPLVQKWQDELRTKFMVSARACDAADLIGLIRENDREGFAAVASLPGLRPPRGWNDPGKPAKGARADLARLLADNIDADLFDLVIFDEAHHLRNSETMNHRLASLVTAAADYKLFLSATPINLRANDLRALLKLLDPDTFEREWLFDVMQNENRPLVAAWEAARNPKIPLAKLAERVATLPEGQILKTGERLKRLRAELAANPVDSPALRVQLAARLEEMSLLGSIVSRTRRRDVAEFKVERRPQTARWTMSAIERQFYDAASARIEEYACTHELNERFLLAQSQRLVASSLAAAYRRWGEKSGLLLLDEDLDDAGPRQIPGPLIAALGEVCTDITMLEALEREDTKVELLRLTLTNFREEQPDQKIIIFSSFRDTIAYLARRLAQDGLTVIQLHGGIKEDRQDTVTRFADASPGTVLLTSEVGGEGLDLQFCRTIINWDLPWNPMKVEQRIGRVDRIGQASPTIDIVNLIAASTIEEMVYERLYERLDIIRETLGDFEPILGEMIRDIELTLANPELTLEERERELERAAQAAAERKREAEELEREAPGLVAHGDSILQKVREAHAPHKMLMPDDLRDYVVGALAGAYDGSRFDLVPGLSVSAYDVRLSARCQAEFARFREISGRRYPTLFGRDATTSVRVAFGSNPDLIRNRNIEAVPTMHPLARFAGQVREDLLAGIAPRPVAAFRVDGSPDWKLARGRYVFAIERWSIDAVVPVDRITIVGADSNGADLIPPETAEQVVIEALTRDPAMMALNHSEIASIATLLECVILPRLKVLRDDFEQAEAARHFDLAETQKALILEHRDRQQSKARERIRDLEMAGTDGRRRAARLEQAKLEKFLAKMDMKLDDIRRRESGFHLEEPDRVGIAVIDLI